MKTHYKPTAIQASDPGWEPSKSKDQRVKAQTGPSTRNNLVYNKSRGVSLVNELLTVWKVSFKMCEKILFKKKKQQNNPREH